MQAAPPGQLVAGDAAQRAGEQRQQAERARRHPGRGDGETELVDVVLGGDIVDELPLSQSTVSQHLKELKQAGLIKGEIDGPRVCYCINNEVFANCCAMLGLFVEQTQLQQSKCC
ncbi:MAG: transcriptional regulator [Deltaproteobacteria bacterium]|nr:MAG: transcriptional regulator [Deltaproteobacteria bacterium]